jgi:TRAP-type C4-dicarboxylate transport system permease small subunit
MRESGAFFRYPTMLATLDRWLLGINRWAVIALLAAMAVMVFANVALRFTTDYSILWVEEASRFTMVWLTFIGAGLVLRYGGHIGIDSLQQATPRLAPVLRAVIVVVMALFFCAMLVIGVRYATLTWAQTTPVLEIPVRRRLSGDAGRLCADAGSPGADGPRIRHAAAGARRRRVRRRRGEALNAAW